MDSKLVYLLIGATQEQQKEIESLKAKIDNNKTEFITDNLEEKLIEKEPE